MPKVEFAGQSARDADNITANPSRLVNGYREPMLPGGRAGGVLRAVPGMAGLAEVTGVFCRAMLAYDGKIATIIGTDLYEVSSDGGVTLLGDVDATDGIAGLAESTGDLVAVAGRKYWRWDGTTLTNPTTGTVTATGSPPSPSPVWWPRDRPGVA